MQRLWSSTALAGSYALTNLFPFPTEYGVFTGMCEEANPIVYPGNADYFPTYTGSVQTDPGGTHTVTVRQPPMNIRVRDRNNVYANSSKGPALARQVRVFATMQTDPAECTEPTYELHTTSNPHAAAADAVGWASHTKLNTLTGLPEQPFDPGLPFGVYNLCIDYQNSAGSSNWRRMSYTGYDNTAPLGRPGTPLVLPAVLGAGGAADWSSSGTTVGTNKCAP